MKLLFTILLLSIVSYASANFALSSFKSQVEITPFMSYLIDNQKNLDIHVVQKSTQFSPMKKSNFGIQSFALWTKLIIANDTNKDQSFILSNTRPAIDKLDVYLIKQNRIIKTYKIGDARPMNNRALYNHHSVVPIELISGETITVITRCENIGAMEGGWISLSSTDFIKNSMHEFMIFGAFGGLMLTFIFYNSILFFTLKEKPFLYYTLYGFSALLYQLSTNGVFYEWNIVPVELLNNLTYPIGYSMIVFILIFNSAFFKTKQYFPKIYIITSLLAILLATLSAFAFYVQQTPYLYLYARILNIIVLISLAILFVSGLYFTYLKKSGAFFYTIGQGSFFIIIAYQVLLLIGVFQTTPFVLYAAMVGILLDMIFLSIALGYQLKYVMEEKKRNDKIIILTSRFASMGQVVGNIAHQWKVPLVRLGALMMELEAYIWSKSSHLEEQLITILPKMKETLNFMDETIQEFGAFYKSDSNKISFNIAKQIEEINHLLVAKIIALNATIIMEDSCKLEYHGYKNAFAQIIMILLDNALEVAKKRAIQAPYIRVFISYYDGGFTLHVKDNCGGVEQNPVDSIFDIFESDQRVNDSGLGLAIARKMIRYKMDGEISAKNTQEGAEFILKLPFVYDIS